MRLDEYIYKELEKQGCPYEDLFSALIHDWHPEVIMILIRLIEKISKGENIYD